MALNVARYEKSLKDKIIKVIQEEMKKPDKSIFRTDQTDDQIKSFAENLAKGLAQPTIDEIKKADVYVQVQRCNIIMCWIETLKGRIV